MNNHKQDGAVIQNRAFCTECKCLVEFTPDRKFIRHEHGGLVPNGVECKAGLQVVPVPAVFGIHAC